MSLKNVALCIFAFLFVQSCFAKFILNIGIVNKKGADTETPLVSEYYTREEVYSEPIVIKTKDQLVLKIKAAFASEKDIYGPSRIINIQGELINMLTNERKPIFVEIPLGEKNIQNLRFSKERVIDVIFEPVI